MGFSEQLKKARLNMNYTQQEVADLMGITKSTYCGYETGKRQPDVAKIKQLATILNTSGDILLETGFEDITSELDINDEVRQLAQQYSLLNDSDRELIKKMIDSLVEKSK
jgi:Predicted transcriptional regulator